LRGKEKLNAESQRNGEKQRKFSLCFFVIIKTKATREKPMSALPQRVKMTEAEYLAFEFESETKNEFFNGEIFAMAGASNEHLLITGSTYAALYNQTVDRPS
jgi:hypothetical protein